MVAGTSATAKQGTDEGKDPNIVQTLDRGLQALQIISMAPEGLTVQELATHMGLHRAITYRLVKTLELHRLVMKGPGGKAILGPGLLPLSSRFAPQLRSISRPLLQTLSHQTGASAFISIAEGNDCVPIDVVDADNSILHVTYRIGSRHPLNVGAAGIAILAGRPPAANDPDEVKQARAEGVSVSRGQIQSGAVGVASPVILPGGSFSGIEASIGVVALNNLDIDISREAVMSCARELSELLK